MWCCSWGPARSSGWTGGGGDEFVRKHISPDYILRDMKETKAEEAERGYQMKHSGKMATRKHEGPSHSSRSSVWTEGWPL